ncbi:hypothetical protein [Geminocystis sp. GBBB08]|uniref:hypothetical protein n=1 Tax=Geminocystis sp. GBBB08 TaxID=2604140 RepID=UPI0027E26298|nr:hypothetical protein [Geminocystis sp. GBBB08]MBL1210629.1 hypothetical protein [Geminocystis sp. GBBB08]
MKRELNSLSPESQKVLILLKKLRLVLSEGIQTEVQLEQIEKIEKMLNDFKEQLGLKLADYHHLEHSFKKTP